MNCEVIKDLLPLYIDECCSEESKKLVKEHICDCDDCRRAFEDMSAPSESVATPVTPAKLHKLNDWKASVLQSVLLFVSFALITVGVALEAGTPSGLLNGFWAFNVVIPATGFMLSLANWYFVKVYKSRAAFSCCSFLATLIITISASLWAMFHYQLNLFTLFTKGGFLNGIEGLGNFLELNMMGVLLTAMFCVISKLFSDRYAKMLGKE